MKVVYQEIAKCYQAMLNNADRLKELQKDSVEYNRVSEWYDRWEGDVERLTKEYMPSGSGFNCGTKFMFDQSRIDKLVFFTEFEHMNENGFYVGWTQHKVIVRPSLVNGFDIQVTGRNRFEIKDYIYQTFEIALNEEIPEPVECEIEKAELAMYLTGNANFGSFKDAFYELLFKADESNLDIIAKGFPGHVEALRIYKKFGENSPEFNSFRKKNS